MTSITSKAKFRQRVIRYSEKYGVTAASIRHRVTRKTIYDWKKKYDGSWKSLVDGSHRPHRPPKQHTAIDECTRYCFREMYDEHSTYSSLDFLKKLIEYFPFPIREIQTDNGTEWTNALLVKKSTHKTLFEEYLEENEIIYHKIQVATPRHNGKVERQHRIDEQRFYSKMRMYNLADGRKQIAKYNKLSNSIPKCCLKYRSPNEVLGDYLSVM